jgi:tetratricopeptide (TPR) repeat protein
MTPIPKKAVSAYEKALKCIEESDRASAIVLLETAVEIEPDFYDAVNRLGGEYLKAGIFRKAEKMLNRARQINPKDPMPLTNLGVLYYQEGEGVLSKSRGTGEEGAPEPAEISFRKAAAVLEDALLLDPLQSKINYYLGTVLYRIGSFKRAEKLLLNAISFDARLREAHITLLNLYSRQKRYGDAVKQIQAYLKKYPDAPQRSRLEAFMAQIDSIPGKR